MRREEQGITLIALIITVIVMLILAAVSISLTIGENGILGKSKDSAQVYDKEEAKQTMNMKITSLQMQNYTKKQRLPTLQELADGLCEDEEMEYVQLASKTVASLDKITIGENKSIYTKIKKYPYEFEINDLLQLASIDGVKLAQGDNSNEELKLEVEELKSSVKQLQEENNLLKESNKLLNNKITLLGNSTMLNHRMVNAVTGMEEYKIEKKYPLIIIAVSSCGEWTGQYAADTKIEVSNTEEKKLITLANNTRRPYGAGYYGSSMTLAYMVEPEIGTIIKASAAYYGEMYIYALGEEDINV